MIELGACYLIAAVAAIATLIFASNRKRSAAFKRSIQRPLRRRAIMLGVLFCLGVIVPALPALRWGVSVPAVHDEFSNLLLGDTLAHFRLTNPPHPLAEFFDTMHELQRPTYASKFPIGLGIFLAVGFWLGLPLAGVWLSNGLACAAIGWMAEAFLPRRWAFFAGLIAVFSPLEFWWAQTYWGGTVGVIGGALLIGAAGRARKSPRAAHGVQIGAGLAILANTRPFEGMLLALFVAAWMAMELLRRHPLRQIARTLIAPAAAVLLPVFIFMGYYNWRVTGNALTLPYVAHARQYMVAPLMFGESPRPIAPDYSNPDLRTFYGRSEMREYNRVLAERQRVWPLLADRWGEIATTIYFCHPSIVGLVGLLAVLRRQSFARFALFTLAALPTLAMFLTPWSRPTYYAPQLGLVFVAMTLGLREIGRLRWRNWKFGIAIAVACLAMHVAYIARVVPLTNILTHEPLAVVRAGLVDQMAALGGRHLVIVHYHSPHNPLEEIVFNGADIDGSPIVFARSLGTAKDRAIVDYFSARAVWDFDYAMGRYAITPRSDRHVPATQPLDGS